MTKSHKDGVAMVKNDVGNAVHALVTGDRDGWQ